MKRVIWNVVDYKEQPIDIDYSEKITEPGLVLSMREIYQRYAAQGVDLLRGELVDDSDQDEDIFEPDIEERVDMLQAAASLRASSSRPRGKRSASKPEGSEEPKADPSAKEPEQSDDDEGSKDQN